MIQKLALSNGVEIPQLGLGIWQSGSGAELKQAVDAALDCGYRHFDTASFYQNEKALGEVLKGSSIPREELFITTKVWNEDQGYEATIKAFEASLSKLNSEYVDLYLVHWPVTGQYKSTWKALEYLYNQGLVKAIGVSNFLKHHLEDLLSDCSLTPMINQLEHHPYLVQKELQDYCLAKNIRFESWSPLMQGKIFDDAVLNQLATAHNKSIAQIILRWNIQNGIVTIPKSINPKRIAENSNVWDFELSTEEMQAIDALDKHQRVGPDPDLFV